eukprot:CAMPEP_0202375350 /NCGR_PEP_ID=MMETSP1127-20130417/6036_1 /ASSEMBLY_ACC=CAM_ASM_000462 /TAXON_ID=3047 /ORGANISM="Dunaliella tertiolecta, Strain CCMP1320" /LENGTH=75 /DNA_ID=CAMNT_0048972793 /DNA_START=56 /DNA_END=281 /DNA_ORIENTATION=+
MKPQAGPVAAIAAEPSSTQDAAAAVAEGGLCSKQPPMFVPAMFAPAASHEAAADVAAIRTLQQAATHVCTGHVCT